MANSRIRQQRQGSTNTEGYAATSNQTTIRTPGKQTVRRTNPQQVTTQAADDEGIQVTFSIPIDGIC